MCPGRLCGYHCYYFNLLLNICYNSNKDTYSPIGQGLVKFTERGTNAEQGVRLPGAQLLTDKGIRDLLDPLPASCCPSCFPHYVSHMMQWVWNMPSWSRTCWLFSTPGFNLITGKSKLAKHDLGSFFFLISLGSLFFLFLFWHLCAVTPNVMVNRWIPETTLLDSHLLTRGCFISPFLWPFHCLPVSSRPGS